jgi:hypothetical protein
VLQLQLKRFDYDPNADAMVKINQRFEFPSKLNLKRFVAPNSDDNKKVNESLSLLCPARFGCVFAGET